MKIISILLLTLSSINILRSQQIPYLEQIPKITSNFCFTENERGDYYGVNSMGATELSFRLDSIHLKNFVNPFHELILGGQFIEDKLYYNTVVPYAFDKIYPYYGLFKVNNEQRGIHELGFSPGSEGKINLVIKSFSQSRTVVATYKGTKTFVKGPSFNKNQLGSFKSKIYSPSTITLTPTCVKSSNNQIRNVVTESNGSIMADLYLSSTKKVRIRLNLISNSLGVLNTINMIDINGKIFDTYIRI